MLGLVADELPYTPKSFEEIDYLWEEVDIFISERDFQISNPKFFKLFGYELEKIFEYAGLYLEDFYLLRLSSVL